MRCNESMKPKQPLQWFYTFESGRGLRVLSLKMGALKLTMKSLNPRNSGQNIWHCWEWEMMTRGWQMNTNDVGVLLNIFGPRIWEYNIATLWSSCRFGIHGIQCAFQPTGDTRYAVIARWETWQILVTYCFIDIPSKSCRKASPWFSREESARSDDVEEFAHSAEALPGRAGTSVMVGTQQSTGRLGSWRRRPCTILRECFSMSRRNRWSNTMWNVECTKGSTASQVFKAVTFYFFFLARSVEHEFITCHSQITTPSFFCWTEHIHPFGARTAWGWRPSFNALGGWRRWTWMWLSGEAPTMLEGNRGGLTFQVVEFHGVRSALTRWFLLFIFIIYHFNSFHIHRHIFSNCKIVGTDACGTFVWLVERFRGNLCRCFRLRLPWNSAIFSTRTPGLALPKIQSC